MNIFFKWLWLALLIFTGIVYGFCLGFFHKIYQYDISHLTLVIYFIFICTTFKIGEFAWKIDKIIGPKKKKTEQFVEMVQTWATRAQYIGVIGTVAGLGIAFASFSDSTDKADILAKVGTCVFNILISMGTFILLDVQCRHVYVNVRKEYFPNETQ